MQIDFGNQMIVDDAILDSASRIAAEAIVKAIPEEYLCMAVIKEINERTFKILNTMPISFFQQCLEEHKK